MKDAARVTCYAIRDGGESFDGLFELIEDCAGDVAKDYIAKEVEKRVKPIVCDALQERLAKLQVKLVKVLSPLRLVRVLYSVADGFLQDIEDFRFAGLRVPRTFTQPLRDLLDSLGELLDTVDEFVAEVFDVFNEVEVYCGENQNE